MTTRAKRTPRKPAAVPAAKAAARRAAAGGPAGRRRSAAGEAAPEEIGGRAGAATAAVYNDAADRGQEQLSRASRGLLQGQDDAARSGRESADVLMRATGAVARAAEDLGKAWVDFAQLSLENGATLARGVAEARSLHDLVGLQADMACRSVDLAVLEGQRLSELGRTVAIEALLPLQAQLAHVFTAGFRRPD